MKFKIARRGEIFLRKVTVDGEMRKRSRRKSHSKEMFKGKESACPRVKEGGESIVQRVKRRIP